MTNKTPSILKFDPNLAKAIGLSESIVISQIDHYLQLSSKNDKYKTDDDGKKWTYNSVREWTTQFPFWSKTTIGRLLKNLEKDGYIVSRSRGRRGERKWSHEYTINYAKLASFPEVKCPEYGTKSKNELDVPKSGQRDSQMSRNRDKEPENTKISNTKNSFPHKKGKAALVERGNTARPLQHDNSPANMSIELSPELMENWLTQYPAKTKDELAHRYSAAANWLLAHGQFTDELRTISFANVNIEKENINSQGNSKKRTVHITGGVK